MSKKTLFFDDCLDGHHLEYIHHLYINCNNFSDEFFVFVLPDSFKKVSVIIEWPTFGNVAFDFINDKDLKKLQTNTVFKSYYLCLFLKKAIKKHKVSNVFLISLMGFMPFLPFFMNRKVKVSGIIYLIYLYRWKRASLSTKILDSFKYILFSKSAVFSTIYLLNDKVAPIYLNKKFKTLVFDYLPDPFICFEKGNMEAFSSICSISDDKTVCLHFGALTERKGTLEILQAIIDANEIAINKCCFVFAGKIFDDIKERFYLLLAEAEKKTQIIVFDKFCEFQLLTSLCSVSNFILIPYKNPEQSSGVIGYAAHFRVPVVAPESGLLGKLVKRYNLGFRLSDSNASGISYFFDNIDTFNMKINSEYLNDKSIKQFNKSVFK